METQKGPHKDYSPLKWGYMGFHVSLGECRCCKVCQYLHPEEAIRLLTGSRGAQSILDEEDQTGLRVSGSRGFKVLGLRAV